MTTMMMAMEMGNGEWGMANGQWLLMSSVQWLRGNAHSQSDFDFDFVRFRSICYCNESEPSVRQRYNERVQLVKTTFGRRFGALFPGHGQHYKLRHTTGEMGKLDFPAGSHGKRKTHSPSRSASFPELSSSMSSHVALIA